MSKSLIYIISDSIKGYGKKTVLSFIALWLSLNAAGCVSQQALDIRIQKIKQEHGVTVKADNPLLRSNLLHNLPSFLDTIDEVLEKIPYEYFKKNVGDILVEESFLDDPITYLSLNPSLAGYIKHYSKSEKKRGFPIHVRDRSSLEKIVFISGRDDEIIVEELTHSYTARIVYNDPNHAKRFVEEFDPIRKRPSTLSSALYPFLNVGVNFFIPTPYLHDRSSRAEYVALIHRIMYTNNCNIEFLKEEDPILYKECKLVEKFLSGGYRRDKPIEHSTQMEKSNIIPKTP